MLFAQTPIEAEALKSALFGLLPDNWRMWAAGIGLVVFAVLNPQVAWGLIVKLWDFGAFVVGKARGVKLPAVDAPSTLPSGISTPLEAAQLQVKWAIENKNAAVFESGTATLKALLESVAKTAALLIAVTCLGCSAAMQEVKQAADPECDYSHHYSFGYQPLTQTDRERVYHAEPTLSQQAPELFRDDTGLLD